MGTEYGTKWVVYPHFVPDPTFQKLTREQREKEKELRISGIEKPGDDIGSSKMTKENAVAIAALIRTIEGDRYKDLGMVVNQIDVNPDGPIARILDKEYGIRAIETEGNAPSEVKR